MRVKKTNGLGGLDRAAKPVKKSAAAAASLRPAPTKLTQRQASGAASGEENSMQMRQRMAEAKRCLSAAFKANKNHPVHYLKFITHPTSFEVTVRNMLTMTFLLKEEKVAILVDSNDQPYVYLIEDEDKLKNRPGSDLVVDEDDLEDIGNWIQTIDTPLWREMVEKLKVTEPMITEPTSSYSMSDDMRILEELKPRD